MGDLVLKKTTTGQITLTPQDVAGNQTITFPATTGTVALLSGGVLPVSQGGTGTSTAFTTGSVVFAGASGVYSQNNSNLFWDNTNNRLGVGTTSPLFPISVNGNIGTQTGVGNVRLESGGASNSGYISYYAANNTTRTGYIGYSTLAGNGTFNIVSETSGNAVIVQTNNGSGQIQPIYIGPNGQINYAYQPCLRVACTNAGDVTNTNAYMPFNVVALNRGGGTFNTGTYEYTIPTTGYYRIWASVYGTASGGTATMGMRIYVDGADSGVTIGDTNIGSAAAGQVSIAPIVVQGILNLTAGAKVKIYSTAYNGAVLFRFFSGSTMWTIDLLG